jgi:hypothetical protein
VRWNASRISSTVVSPCWPAASAIGSPRVSPAPTFGRVFLHPHAVFTEEMLRPELQDLDVFVDGVANIVATHQRVAESYFADGTISLACPPLQGGARDHGARGDRRGLGLDSPECVRCFPARACSPATGTPSASTPSKRSDEKRLTRAVASLYEFLDRSENAEVAARLGLVARRAQIQGERVLVGSAAYRAGLVGTIGRQPL